jgi:hypothetical protein
MSGAGAHHGGRAREGSRLDGICPRARGEGFAMASSHRVHGSPAGTLDLPRRTPSTPTLHDIYFSIIEIATTVAITWYAARRWTQDL